jgi:hypothetical protein
MAAGVREKAAVDSTTRAALAAWSGSDQRVVGLIALSPLGTPKARGTGRGAFSENRRQLRRIGLSITGDAPAGSASAASEDENQAGAPVPSEKPLDG